MSSRTTVNGTGPLDCEIAIIGEAPGAEEERAGKPFIGMAGRLLDQLLTKGGIVRQACYIDNTVPIRPRNNDITEFLDISKKTPLITQEYTDGVGRLKSLLETCTANCIIALGNTPLYALTGRTGITKWRGSILESTLLPGRKVLPTLHPSYALRDYLAQRIIIADLQRAARQSAFPDIRRPVYELEVFPSYQRTTDYLWQTLHGAKSVAVDIEVIGTEVKCIAFSVDKTHAISIPFTANGSDYFDPHQEMEVWRLIGRILESESITKIFQNGMFDLTFIYERYGIVPRNLDDTMVAHAILFPDYRHGLDFITSTYTEHPYYKDEGKQWNKLTVDEKAFAQYNARDAIICSEVMPKLIDDLTKQGNLETYRRQMRLTQPLMYIQSKGIRLDKQKMDETAVATKNKIGELTAELHRIAGCNLNPQSPKQLQTYFYVNKGYPPYTYQGRITTDEMAMKRLARKGASEASIILEIRKNAKMLGTYLEVNLDEDQRMRGAFRVVGTTSGRISSSKTIFGTGGNLQNQPPEMKRFFLADEGHILYNIDLSQAENRLVAYMAPEPAMIHAFETGQDVHALTASMISGISVEEVIRQQKAVDDLIKRGITDYKAYEGLLCPIGSGDKTWRFWGKKCNHGLNYGLGYKKFAILYEIMENESKRLVEAYHHAYPCVRYGFHEYVQHCLKQDKTLTNPYGRKRLFLDRWGEELFKDAYSFLPQSTVPDKMWVDGILPVYERQDIFNHVSLMNTVHDSMSFQISLEHSWETHARIVDTIVKQLEKPIPWKAYNITIPCDVEVGFNMKQTVKLKGRTAADLKSAYDQLTAETKAA